MVGIRGFGVSGLAEFTIEASAVRVGKLRGH